MLFNSVSFLIYFPIVVLINFVLPKKARNIWLLVASYYFYMWQEMASEDGVFSVSGEQSWDFVFLQIFPVDPGQYQSAVSSVVQSSFLNPIAGGNFFLYVSGAGIYH